MVEGPIGLSHPIDFILSPDRVAFITASRDQLIGQTIGHRLVTTLTGVGDEPLHSQGRATLGVNLDGNLVGGTTDTTTLDLQDRLRVVEGLLEDIECRLPSTLLHDIHRIVEDTLSK